MYEDEKQKRRFIVVGVVLFAALAFAIYLNASVTNEDRARWQARDRARTAADNCWHEQGRKSLDSETARGLAYYCERMDKAAGRD